jgi:transcriptional regulator with XRE-family HTH domain
LSSKEQARLAAIIGDRIKFLRLRGGHSRLSVARRLSVDATAIAAWEAGKYLPRQSHRISLARFLGIDISALFKETPDEVSAPVSAALVDTLNELPGLLEELLSRTRRTVRALRVAAPYPTPAYAQQRFRTDLSARLLDRSLEVQRIEIFYDLKRVKEVLSNVLRYDGCAYYVKSYCIGTKDIVPAMGGYFFDNDEFLLGAYWSGVPPHDRPGLQLSGEPFRTYFKSYWGEIWQRGTLLNLRGAHDLTALQESAFTLGLKPKQWPQFLKEAEALEIGDGAPPLA